MALEGLGVARRSLVRLLLDTPMDLRGRTLRDILKRKFTRKLLKASLRADGIIQTDHGNNKKKADFGGLESKLIGLADDIVILRQKLFPSKKQQKVRWDKVDDSKNKDAGAFDIVRQKLAFAWVTAKLSSLELEKEAPFKSQAQRRKFYAMENRGEISPKTLHKWEGETPDRKLPERVKSEKAAGAIGRAASFVARSAFFPTSTATMIGNVGIGAGMAGIAGMKAPTPSQRMTRMADLADKLVKSASMGNWLRRGVAAVEKIPKVVNPGKATEETIQGVTGAAPHISRGAV